jgi:hypothetical protein
MLPFDRAWEPDHLRGYQSGDILAEAAPMPPFDRAWETDHLGGY